MTQNGPAPDPVAGKPTVYRGPAASIGGALIAAFCLFGFFDLLIEAGTQDLPGAAVLFLVAVLGVVYGPYPAAFSGDAALRVRNPLRAIELPWAQVTEMNAHLSFIVRTGERKFTVWAIPVSLHDRRRQERHRLRQSAQARRPQRRGSLPMTDPLVAAAVANATASRIEQLPFADQALAEMSSRHEAYTARAKVGAAPEGPAELAVRWSLGPAAVIAAALVFVIVAFIVR